MNNITLGQLYLNELEAEARASRKCLERIPANLFSYKPHEKSLDMGYFGLLVAEVPLWIKAMASGEGIDFATWKHSDYKSAEDLVKQFDDNMAAAKKALEKISDEDMAKTFELKAGGKVIMSMPIKDFIGSSINHQIHHRGQLTVYLRLNNIPVPSIYGPSADEKDF
ncbi:MAG: DinB family protein [Candidatus Doudnabacteria bacterium]|nr:DinB family protein [Candidatus Doudnabacteria bacterium]